MKTVSQETRKRMSASARLRCNPEWRKTRSEMYRAKIDDKALRELYESGMTQAEVAACLGTSQKVVFSAMVRLNIPRRPAIKRNQKGSANDTWKGDGAGYQAFHRRLDAMFGKPKCCAVCGNTSRRFYDWANLTGKYTDLKDYKRMCRSCHSKYDQTHKNFKGATGARKSSSRVVMPNA